jgi:pyruvate carboxylase
VGEPHTDGRRTVFFELNGQPREVTVVDHSLETETQKRLKADPADPKHIGAAMPGMIVTVAVQPGDLVAKGQKLLTLEAMKMETTIYAEQDGKVAQVHAHPGSQVETGDLLVTLE